MLYIHRQHYNHALQEMKIGNWVNMGKDDTIIGGRSLVENTTYLPNDLQSDGILSC